MKKQPAISLDDDIESADWTKQSWDLPPYKSPEFLTQFPDIDAFRRLPAYQHAVSKGLIRDDEWVIHSSTPPSKNNQVVGNVGLYYVCYLLSRRGWNVMPTARNAKGIDILIYSQDARRTRTIQVKALSKASPVPLGGRLDNIFGDFFVICRALALEKPECFVLTPAEVRELAHKGEKEGKVSYWLQPKQYAKNEYRDQWQRIGDGTHSL